MIDEELHDIRRVQNHGQEEDLKMALSKMISRVEELVSPLFKSYLYPLSFSIVHFVVISIERCV